MKLRSIISYVGWPAAAGLLMALLVLLGIGTWQNGYRLSLPALSQVKNPSTQGPAQDIPTTNEPGTWNGAASYANAVKKAAPSVVNIRTAALVTERPSPVERFFSQAVNRSAPRIRQRIQQSLGSGVIITPDGYILTNNHVVSGADAIQVSLNDGREADARIVGYDREFDLAVIKIELENLNPMAAVRMSDDLEVGDVVLAIGNPFGVGQTVTQGIISATGRVDRLFNSYLQTDAAINPGNSGGALIDAYGNLVGINSTVLNANNSTGIGFAIPADMAVKVLGELKEFGRVIRGWMGVDAVDVTPAIANQLQLDLAGGVFVTGVEIGSPAQLAGIQRFDVITHINDQEISNTGLLSAQVQRTPPGEQMTITAWREGQTFELEAVIGEKPEKQAR